MGMHNHSFGDFLLERNVIDTMQLIDALRDLTNYSRPSMATALIYSGDLIYKDIEDLYEESKKTGIPVEKIAAKKGYITKDSFREYRQKDYPIFVTLADVLIKKGHLTYHQFQDIYIAYESETAVYQIETNVPLRANTDDSIDFLMEHMNVSNQIITRLYFRLLFNSFYNTIGGDFSVLCPFRCDSYPASCLVAQDVIYNDIRYTLAIDLEEHGFIDFASRYSGETLTSLEDLTFAAVEDFINLHNGVFNVNLSNEYGIEATLSALRRLENSLYSPEGMTYLMAVIFPFGSVNVLVTAPYKEETEEIEDDDDFDYSQFLIK